MTTEPWSCYCLRTCDGTTPTRTYVGATADIHRRLKQHNRELPGGAKATEGRKWERICHVSGFPDQRAALQFEWRWKQLSRKIAGTPTQRRIKGLEALLALEKPTSAASTYDTYVGGGPTVILEDSSLID